MSDQLSRNVYQPYKKCCVYDSILFALYFYTNNLSSMIFLHNGCIHNMKICDIYIDVIDNQSSLNNKHVPDKINLFGSDP